MEYVKREKLVCIVKIKIVNFKYSKLSISYIQLFFCTLKKNKN